MKKQLVWVFKWRKSVHYYIKLCASFQIHRWIETEVTVRKHSIRAKICDFFVLCDLEILWMTLENNRAPFLYYTKLCASFQNPSVKSNWSYSPETLNLGQNRQFFVPCNLEIWRMTLQNNRAPLLCHFKLVYHFIPNGEFKFELQSGNAQFGSNSTIFRAVRPWNLMDDLEKQ